MHINRLYKLIQSLDNKEKNKLTNELTKELKSKNKKGTRKPVYFKLYQFCLEAGKSEYDLEPMRLTCRDNHPSLLPRLYKLMRDYQNKKNDGKLSQKISLLLLDAQFLFDKTMYKESWTKLQDAKEMAKSIFRYADILQINQLMTDILLFATDDPYFTQTEITLESLNEESEKNMNYLKKHTTQKFKYGQLLALLKQKAQLNPQEKETLERDYSKYFSKNSDKKISLADYRYLQSKAIYHRLLDDAEEEIETLKATIEWWENHKIYKQEELYRYYKNIINIVNLILREKEKNKKQFEQIDNYFNKIKPLVERFLNQSTEDSMVGLPKIKTALFKCTFNYLCSKRDYETYKELFKNEDSLKGKNLSAYDQEVLSFYIIQFEFLLTNYEKCNKLFEKFKQRNKDNSHEKLQNLYRQVIPHGILSKLILRVEKDSNISEQEVENLIKESQDYFCKSDSKIYFPKFDEFVGFLSTMNTDLKKKRIKATYRALEDFINNENFSSNNPYKEEVKEWSKNFNDTAYNYIYLI